MHVVVIGCGFHGRGIAYELAEADDITEITVVDKDRDVALEVAQKIGAKPQILNIQDRAGLCKVISGAGMVFNGVGPYHYRRNAVCVVEAAITERVPYVDMNDDHEPTETLLLDPKWNQAAVQAEIPVFYIIQKTITNVKMVIFYLWILEQNMQIMLLI